MALFSLHCADVPLGNCSLTDDILSFLRDIRLYGFFLFCVVGHLFCLRVHVFLIRYSVFIDSMQLFLCDFYTEFGLF